MNDAKTRQHSLLRHAGSLLRKELRRYDLRHREETVLYLLIDLSFGLGIREVRVPKLDVFVDMTGISRANVSRVIESLHGMGILDVNADGELPVYRVNANVNEWRCRIRSSSETTRRAIELIKAVNGLDAGGDRAIAAVDAMHKTAQQKGSQNFKDHPHTDFSVNLIADLATIAEPATRRLPLLD
jgi:hypothetical protein